MLYPQFGICDEEFNNPNPRLITTAQTSGCLWLAKWLWEYEIEYILGTSTTGAALVIGGAMTAQ
tara:strand:- start:374 stop:565 length:192 start_codon:yes stop_codon:yes gene_type:complete